MSPSACRSGARALRVLALVALATTLAPPAPSRAQDAPLPAGVVLEDSLTTRGVFREINCPTGRAGARFGKEGYELHVAGRCTESGEASVGERARTVLLPDGEVRLQFQVLSGGQRAELRLWLRDAGAGEVVSFAPASGTVQIRRPDTAEPLLAERQVPSGTVLSEGWNTLGVRLRGAEVWVLLNDQVVLSATSASVAPTGGVSLELARRGDPADAAEVVVVTRGLRVSALAGGDPARAPTVARIESELPAAAQAVLEDELSAPGAVQESTCPTGLGARRFSDGGYRMSVSGPCNEASRIAAVPAGVQGLRLADGEVKIEVREESEAQLARLRLFFRGRAGEGSYHAAIDLGLGHAMLVRIREGEPAVVLDRRFGLGYLIKSGDWNTITLRVQGNAFWLLVNDRLVLAAADASFDRSGPVILDLQRLGALDDRRESAVLVRNLRVSALATQSAREPTLIGRGPATEPVLAAILPPPAVGDVALADALTQPGLLAPSVCPTGRNSTTYVPEGMLFRVAGRCFEAGQVAAISQRIGGLDVPDGEVRVQFKLVSGDERALVRLAFRSDRAGVLRYFAVIVPATRQATLWRADAEGVHSLGAWQDSAGLLSPRDWNTLAVRYQGSDIWLLLNDQVVIHAVDRAFDRGSVFLALERGGSLESAQEVALLVRDLQVSALQAGDLARAPSMVESTEPEEPGDGLESNPSPLPGLVMLLDPLTAAGIAAERVCPTQRGAAQPTGEGYRFTVSGVCGPEGTPTLLQPLAGFNLPDGELYLELRLVDSPDRGRVLIPFRYGPVATAFYYVALEPASGTAQLFRFSADGATLLASRDDLQDLLSPTDWNSLALRLEGPDMWLLLNDEEVLFASDDLVSDGAVAIGLHRLGPTDDAPASMLVRNLRISALAAGDPARMPIFAGRPAPPALGPLPEPANAVIDDPLTRPSFVLAARCPSGRGGVDFGERGMTLRVAGRCREEQRLPYVSADVEGVLLADGEVRFEFVAEKAAERALFRVIFREVEDGSGAYFLFVAPGEGYVALQRFSDDRLSTLAERGDLGRLFTAGRPVTVALRLRGPSIWLLLNDEPALSATDAAFDQGGITFQLARQGPPEDATEVSVILRSLTVSALRGAPPSRIPVLR